MADEAKAKGNAAFAAGNFSDAIKHFSDAINLSPTNHVLYSNRSAAYASLNNFSDALADAKKTVEIKPDWSKGYSRLGSAHLGLHNHVAAIEAYKKGLELDPTNEALKSGLSDAENAAMRTRPGFNPTRPGMNPFGDAFGPEMWAKLTADPSTRAYMQQPDFVNMMKELQKNPSNLNLYLKDPRVMQSLGVLLNIKLSTRGSEDAEMPDVPSERKRPAEEEQVNGKEKKREAEPMQEEMEVSEEEKEIRERKANAQKEKEAGNVAYKKKDFDTAIKHYSEAIELDDTDISFVTNRAAVYLEMGKVCCLIMHCIHQIFFSLF